MNNYESFISDPNQIEIFAFTSDTIPSSGSNLEVFVDLPKDIKLTNEASILRQIGQLSQENFVRIKVEIDSDNSSKRKIQKTSISLNSLHLSHLGAMRPVNGGSYPIGNYLIELVDSTGNSLKKKVIAANSDVDPKFNHIYDL